VKRASAALALLGALALAGPLRAQQADALPEVQSGPSGRLSSGQRIWVEELRVVGSSVLPAEALASALAPYAGRALGVEDLVAARDAVTRLYVERGYVTSGAVLPDQDVADGVVEIHAVENHLGEIRIDGAEHFAARHLQRRIAGREGPLQIAELERRLQLLQMEPGIERVDARLEPGGNQQRSRLRVQIRENSPWIAALESANDAAASLGGQRTAATLGRRNLLGVGDLFLADVSLVRGLFDSELRYELPLNTRDTRLALRYRTSRSEIVEDPSGELDARSRRVSYSADLIQPLWRDRDAEWLVGATGEVAHDQLRVFGERFSFFPSEVEDRGESHVTALRLWNELRLRSEAQALSARVGVSLGLDALGATIYPSSLPGSHVPDGRFAAWLAQLRWASRADRWIEGAQWLARLDLQLANDALLPMERLSIGGSRSVRGYHEHELVRDNGLIASLELRIPVLRDPLGGDRLQLAPFVDLGKGWNRSRDASLQSISSAGLAVYWRVADRIDLAVSWGAKLRSVERRAGDDLQDAGVHVSLRAAAF
jgi:hemolysin activation/secretion protein